MAGRPSKAASPVEELIESARLGSSDALWRLLDHYRLYLLSIAEAELEPGLRAKAGASDLVHDAVLSAQAGFGNFRGRTEGELQGWLRTILLNNLANLRRQPPNGHASNNDLSRLKVQGRNPLDIAIEDEETRALVQALSRLPEMSRQVVHWRQWEKRSFEEIGKLLGKSAEAARKIWSRAVQQLQKEMRGEGRGARDEG
jgi:RNA polymerase sigma-70 factor, ECF subfamily